MKVLIVVLFILAAFSAQAQIPSHVDHTGSVLSGLGRASDRDHRTLSRCANGSENSFKDYLKNYSDGLVRECRLISHTVTNVYNISSVAICMAADTSGSYFKIEYKSACFVVDGLNIWVKSYKNYKTFEELLNDLYEL